MPTWLVFFLVTSLGGLAALALWDVISKRAESVVCGYVLIFIAVIGRAARAAIFGLVALRWLAGLPWRIAQSAMNKPLKERFDALEQRLDSQESILRSRQVPPSARPPVRQPHKGQSSTMTGSDTEE